MREENSLQDLLLTGSRTIWAVPRGHSQILLIPGSWCESTALFCFPVRWSICLSVLAIFFVGSLWPRWCAFFRGQTARLGSWLVHVTPVQRLEMPDADRRSANMYLTQVQDPLFTETTGIKRTKEQTGARANSPGKRDKTEGPKMSQKDDDEKAEHEKPALITTTPTEDGVWSCCPLKTKNREMAIAEQPF